MRNLNQNVAQSSSGGVTNLLGGLMNTWQRKKATDYRFGRESELLLQNHKLGMERDTHRAMQGAIAAGTGAAFESHFNNILETNKSKNKMDQIGETGNQDRLTSKVQGSQDRRTNTSKSKQERLTMADKDKYDTGQKITAGEQTRLNTTTAGEQTRLTREHEGNSNISDMERVTARLDANRKNLGKGISPLVANAGNLQNIGPLLKSHPGLGLEARPAKTAKGGRTVAPPPPPTGTNGPTPDSGSVVTPPKIKKPKVNKPTGTGGTP